MALGLLAFSLMSFHDAIIKYLGASIAVPQIVFFNALFGLPLLLWSARLEGIRTFVPRNPGWVAARTVAHVIAVLATFYAFTVLPLADVYAVIFAAPFAITLLSIPLLRERVGLRQWLAIVAGLIGVLIVLRPAGTGAALGYGSALVGMLGGAAISLVMRRVGKGESNTVMMVYPMLLNLCITGAMLPFLWRAPNLAEVGLNALAALLGFGAMTCLFMAYRRAAAAIVAPTQYSQILWAAVFGLLIFGEAMAPRTVLGAGIIIVAGGFLMFGAGRKRRSAQRDEHPAS